MQVMSKSRIWLAPISALILLAGCHKQPRPIAVVPPPMIPQSAMIPVPEVLPPDDTPIVAPPPEPVVASKPKPRPRSGKKITDLKPSNPAPVATAPVQPPPTAVEAAPPKITASPRDVPTNATISGGLPHSDEQHRTQTAAQLNQSTEDNLRSITRALNSTEKGVVEQIRTYITQSQEAIADNDLVRAHNLALKAHLLSDELAHP
jgi:hypothetical protein